MQCSQCFHGFHHPTNATMLDTHLSSKLALTATPNLSIASVICSLEAAANVARKNISVGTKFDLSAANQLPRDMSTPCSTAARKISSSMAAMSLVLECGCLCQSNFSHNCGVLVAWTWVQCRRITYEHASSGWVPRDYILGQVFFTSGQNNVSSFCVL